MGSNVLIRYLHLPGNTNTTTLSSASDRAGHFLARAGLRSSKSRQRRGTTRPVEPATMCQADSSGWLGQLSSRWRTPAGESSVYLFCSDVRIIQFSGFALELLSWVILQYSYYESIQHQNTRNEKYYIFAIFYVKFLLMTSLEFKNSHKGLATIFLGIHTKYTATYTPILNNVL